MIANRTIQGGRRFRPQFEPRKSFGWKQVLVPVDFSDSSRVAARFAAQLAQAAAASIVLLYIDEMTGDARSGKASRGSRAKPLGDFRRREIPKKLRCKCLTLSGRADIEIIKAAEELKADLIVVPMHGKCSQQGQLGRTVSRVASMSPCPVLLVPVCERKVPFFI